tara:strand:+ start:2982 stop:3803 length:822 start_codon:yes stop_codon:yes gene_type:complete
MDQKLAKREKYSGQSLINSRKLLTLILLGVIFFSFNQIPLHEDLLNPSGMKALDMFFSGLFSIDVSRQFLGLVINATIITIAFAVCGLSLALILGVPLGILASGSLNSRSYARYLSIVVFRAALAVFRSIHELVWAWFFVAAFGLSPLSGILALGINYAGILGRITSELLQDLPDAPINNLYSNGASNGQILIYGRLPLIFPDLLSYIFYRLECAIRSAAILSFVGIAGIGMQIELALDDLLFGRVWTLLAVLALLILAVDLWSSMVRRHLAS